jgi:ribosome-binding protein aMBF1 (putative translation factor)
MEPGVGLEPTTPFLTHRPEEGSGGALQDIEDRTLRTSENRDDPAVSSSYGPNAAQEVSGPKKVHDEIAQVVAARRQQLGISRRELAERIGTSHTVIARIESGRHAPNVKTLERIAAGLDMHLLLSFEDRPRAD